jgi:hypothetical protein
MSGAGRIDPDRAAGAANVTRRAVPGTPADLYRDHGAAPREEDEAGRAWSVEPDSWDEWEEGGRNRRRNQKRRAAKAAKRQSDGDTQAAAAAAGPEGGKLEAAQYGPGALDDPPPPLDAPAAERPGEPDGERVVTARGGPEAETAEKPTTVESEQEKEKEEVMVKEEAEEVQEEGHMVKEEEDRAPPTTTRGLRPRTPTGQVAHPPKPKAARVFRKGGGRY